MKSSHIQQMIELVYKDSLEACLRSKVTIGDTINHEENIDSLLSKKVKLSSQSTKKQMFYVCFDDNYDIKNDIGTG